MLCTDRVLHYPTKFLFFIGIGEGMYVGLVDPQVAWQY